MGEVFCSWLAVLFGKRFDSHGMIQGQGRFHAPTQNAFPPTSYPQIGPNNHKPRRDCGIPLNLEHFGKLLPLFMGSDLNCRAVEIFGAASRLYLRSLRGVDADPEAAVLDLITCGELLSGFYDYNEADLCDHTLRHIMHTIERDLPNGKTIVKALKGRLRQIKRRYVITIMRLLTDNFFAETEASEPFAALKPDNVSKRIAASYDLRSLYVHTGARFGLWMMPHGWLMNEIMLGRPVLEGQRKLSKALVLTPTYIGLERIMRYCLLRFLHLNLTPIDTCLDGPGLVHS